MKPSKVERLQIAQKLECGKSAEPDGICAEYL